MFVEILLAHQPVPTAHREALAPLVVAGAGAALLAAPQARQAAAGGAVVARLDPPLRRDGHHPSCRSRFAMSGRGRVTRTAK